MSSGSGTTTQTTGLPPEYAQILQGFGNAATQAMNQPYQQYNGPRVAELSPLQRQSMQGYASLLGDDSWNQAQGTYSDLQNGSMNPYLDQVGKKVTADVTKGYNDATLNTLRRSNTPGNLNSARATMAQGENDKNLARGLSEGLGSVYSGAYENQQNRRLQAAGGQGALAQNYSGILGNAAQAGNMQRGFDQQVMDTLYQDWTRANDYPWSQIERGADVFGRLQGGMPRTSTTTGPGPDRVSQGLGAWAIGNSMSNGKGSGAAT